MLVLTNIKNTCDGPTVQLPNNATMNVTKTGSISLSRSVVTHAEKAHIFYGLHSASLISLVQLCDDVFISTLDNYDINILKNKTLILKGYKNKTDGLWDITISRPLINCAHAIVTRDKKKIELVKYLHGCCFSPTPITFLNTIKNGNFLTWPGLNNKHLLNHMA